MVVIEIDKNDLTNLIGKQMTDEELESTFSLLKLEAEIDGDKMTVELTPDRPDMFSVEGVARELKGFLGIETGIKKYQVGDSGLTLKKDRAEVRPFIACAIVKDVVLSDYLVKSLMQVQEKLHMTIGRDRKKVAIGVHDFDKVVSPLTYRDVTEQKFVPLNETREMTIKEILEQHPKGKDYAHLVSNGIYPMLYDKEGVLSFPPIINSERTKVTEGTTSLFIDVTGTDEKAVNQALNILVCNITERCGKIFNVKIVNKLTPDLEPKETSMGSDIVNKVLGLDATDDQIVESLEKMRYSAKKKSGRISVSIPPYRSDILHMVDIIEDVAIGYGYNKIEPILPNLATIGSESGLEKSSRKIREIMTGLEFQEILTFVLTSKENNFANMNTQGECAELLNPMSNEFSICRTWLTPDMMKFFFFNKNKEYPQKIFEVGDCVLLDQSSENRTRQARKLCGAISYDCANLTEIKSVVEAVIIMMGRKYEIQDGNHPSFIESRCGKIIIDGKEAGFFGEIHPDVLEKWGIEKPVIAFEIEVE
jgi:phenylalanyl-tRNA synthetase beta chain